MGNILILEDKKKTIIDILYDKQMKQIKLWYNLTQINFNDKVSTYNVFLL